MFRFNGGSGECYAVAAALLWGLNYVVVKLVLAGVSEGQFLLLRFTLSLVALVIWLRWTGEDLRFRKEHGTAILILGLLGVGCYNILWTYGIHLTTAANAALLISTSPIFTGLYSAIRGEGRLTPLNWAGILAAFGGIFLIIHGGASGAGLQMDAGYLWGDLLVLAGAFLFSLYGILAKPLLSHYSPVKLTTLAMGSSLILLIPFSLCQSPVPSWSALSLRNGLAMAYIVLCGTVAAFSFWYHGIQKSNPIRTIIFHYLVPVTSMLLSPLLLGKRPGRHLCGGAALVLAGLLASGWRKRALAAPPADRSA
jgi:drug/metabolite transporter (DMT)-like permease